MKNFTLLFAILIVLSSCTPDRTCLYPPNCAVDLNHALNMQIQFCSDATTEQCYEPEDLNQVVVLRKSTKDDEIVAIDSLINLTNFDNTILLGGSSGIPFTDYTEGGRKVSYNYEITIPATKQHFYITDIEVIDLNQNNYCECPSYHISSFKLNGQTIKPNSATVIVPIGQ